MFSGDRAEFDKQLATMMGGFPGYFLTDERRESYWRGLQKMPMAAFVRLIDFILSEDGPEKIPSVHALWELHRKNRVTHVPVVDVKMSREQHLAQLHRMAIESAKRETMPMFKGAIIRTVPDRFKAEYDQKWKAWDEIYGAKPADYWEPRARELMISLGEKKPDQINFGNALRGMV